MVIALFVMLVALIATCAIKLFNELHVGDIEKMSVSDIVEWEEYISYRLLSYTVCSVCKEFDPYVDDEIDWCSFIEFYGETSGCAHKAEAMGFYGETSGCAHKAEAMEFETELSIYRDMLERIELKKFGFTSKFVPIDYSIYDYNFDCDNHKVGHKAKLLNGEVHDLWDIYRFDEPHMRTSGCGNRRGKQIRIARHNGRKAKTAFKESCYSQYDFC